MSNPSKPTTETTDFTLAEVPAKLRHYAKADVKPMTVPPERSRVEMAAADRIEKLEAAIQIALGFRQVTHIHAALREVVDVRY